MKQPQEYKVVSLRECPTPDALRVCETPQQAADYWRLHVAQHPYYNPDCECFVVLMLNVRRRVKGHHLVTIGTLDSILIYAQGSVPNRDRRHVRRQSSWPTITLGSYTASRFMPHVSVIRP